VTAAPAAAPPQAAGLRDALALPPDLGLLSPLARLTLLVDAEVERIAAAHGIAYADYLVLGVVRRSPAGRGRPTEICAVLGRTTGGMTLTLDRLEAAGWLSRSPDRDDRRRIVVSLTPEGQRLAEAVNDELHSWEASLPLQPDDRAAAGAALGRLVDAVEAREALPA
jgi:DNA-binding MarR family transcriptional regulator